MNELNVERLGKALSDILSRKYDCKVTITFRPKDEVREEQNTCDPSRQNTET
jgi:hypothetical protein